MKFTYSSPAKPLEPGIHQAIVVDASEGMSNSGADQITLELYFEGGMKIKDRLTASEKAMWRVTQAFVAFGFTGKPGESIELDAADLQGKSVTVRVDKKTNEMGKTFLEVVEYVAPSVPI